MNTEETTRFLFAIAQEIKRSFENPVILLTRKDYADCIFNSLVELRNALQQYTKQEDIAEIVHGFHLEWIKAVQDIELFKKRAKDTPRDAILKAVDYTMECTKKRHIYFQRYVEKYQKNIRSKERNTMQADLEIIGDMCEIVNCALVEKHKCLSFQADKADFYVIIMNEIEELLNWLDRLYDHLAIQMTKAIDLLIPLNPGDLVKVLEQIIEEVANCPNVEAQDEVVGELSSKGKKLISAVRVNSLHGFEMSKVIEKIKNLEDRINRLEITDSSTVMALQHKTLYLEERLLSLQNLKLSLNCLKIRKCHVHEDGSVDDDELHIFNHLLPHADRCRLVEELIKLWNYSISGEQANKSIISILSADDIKEVFSDDMGHFSVDKYGRKIYTVDGKEQFYQLNEKNDLVSVMDDDKHVYFYDECGRYYLNDVRERIYKAHPTASEYILNRTGVMLKVAEVENGVEYHYDSLGRYYFDKKGARIYKDVNSDEEYRHDGLGNLVRIRDSLDVYTMCPAEPMVTEDSFYLKESVGAALRKCIAEVVLVQPPDPIRYLAERLEKYRQNIDMVEIRKKEFEELMAEREMNSTVQSKSSFLYEPEESDFNFVDYETTIMENL